MQMQTSKTAEVPVKSVKLAITNLQEALEKIIVNLQNAKFDVKNGAGKVSDEKPETAKAREVISEYATKLPAADKKIFTTNLGCVYWLMGEPTVRSTIVKDSSVLDKILKMQEVVEAVATPEEKLGKVSGFFKK